MTKIEEKAKNYAMYKGDVGYDFSSCKSSFTDGVEWMLDRVCKYLESEHPTWYEHFGDELRKAMEE